MKIALREADSADNESLLRVYAATRAAEMGVAGWDDATRLAFVRMQFDMQQRSYRMQFPAARCQVIECDGVTAGRLWLNRAGRDIRILDIALLPQYRAQGIGRFCLKSVLAEAQPGGGSVRLSVDADNPARRLYERLGFVLTGGGPLRLAMEWSPVATPQSANVSTAVEICNEQA